MFLGVFESSSEDFSNGDDVFEAIGGLLQEVAIGKSEDDIRWNCVFLSQISQRRGFKIQNLPLGWRLVSEAFVCA